MRLIDADSLIENMDKGIQGTAREYLKFYQMAVNDEPTVYDVDKVAEQIRGIMQDESIRFVQQAVNRAIKIIEEGGVNE